MKVCIYGAGAIGGYVAVELAQVQGVEVSVIARGAHLEAMRKNGLKLVKDGEERIAKVNATCGKSTLGKASISPIAKPAGVKRNRAPTAA